MERENQKLLDVLHPVKHLQGTDGNSQILFLPWKPICLEKEIVQITYI